MANDAGGDDNITVMLIAVGIDSTVRLWQRMRQRWLLKAS
jgi:hypothetical protein